MAGESVTIDVRGLQEMRRALGPDLFRRPALEFLERASIDIQSEVIKQTPTGEGLLGNNIRRNVNSHELSARVFTNIPYANFVEHGTRPHWPPRSAVARWARLHGIDPFLVQRAIARYGTSRGAKEKRNLGGSTGPWGYGMFEQGWNKARRDTPRELNRMWRNIRSRWSHRGSL